MVISTTYFIFSHLFFLHTTNIRERDKVYRMLVKMVFCLKEPSVMNYIDIKMMFDQITLFKFLLGISFSAEILRLWIYRQIGKNCVIVIFCNSSKYAIPCLLRQRSFYNLQPVLCKLKVVWVKLYCYISMWFWKYYRATFF